MYHQQLERQIRKHLGDDFVGDEKLVHLLQAISGTYTNYDRDRELAEHAFSLNEAEYQDINTRLTKLTGELEQRIVERTSELEEIAEFPLVNPNAIFRISSQSGEIMFSNPSAQKIHKIIWKGTEFETRHFFMHIIGTLEEDGTLDVFHNKKEFLFFYKKIEGRDYYNIYSADVTEKNALRRMSQESYQRLRNFLESTDDTYYILYEKNPEKNLITNHWKELFGFSPAGVKNLIKERSRQVISEKPAQHLARISDLPLGSRKTIRYQIKHRVSGNLFWVSENISKYRDEVMGDVVISGRITDVTREMLLSMQIRESEQRFRRLIDGVPVMVWVSDEDGFVTYSNKALKDFLGFELEKMKNYRYFSSFIHPDDRKAAIDDWQKNIKKKVSVQTEYRMKDARGEMHNLLEKAVPRFYSDGKFAGYIGAFFDLTKEKLYQETLLIEKEKMELITRNSPDIIILMNGKGEIEYISPTVKTLLDRTPEQMTGQMLDKYICKESKEQLNSKNWLNVSARSVRKYEYRMVTAQKKHLWVESVVSVLRTGKDKEVRILMHNRNIDEVKAAQLAMQESERKYRSLFENLNLGVMEVDNAEKIVWVNRSFEDLTGYSLDYLKGKNARKTFLVTTLGSRQMQDVVKKRKAKQDSIYEIKMRKQDGGLLDIVISGSPIMDMNGQVKGSVGIHWDVTAIRKMEKQIEEEKQIRQKEIMQATIQAEEQQRLVMGNELHDGVGHILTYTSLFLQMAFNGAQTDPAMLSKAQAKVEEALAEVRRIPRNLMPNALTDLGLKEAIIELFNQYHSLNKTKFQLECKPTDFKGIPVELTRTLYRIVQELISNTVKHAEAGQVNLQFKRTAKLFSLHYKDNGKGFDLKKNKTGVGLQSITNRVYFYGGTSKIQAAPGKGCQMTIEWPLQNILNIDRVT
jgi:PAS domain S-box-containing protein